ncbi:MAG: VWA domain-containing protein [Actinomycetota bacterium]|nr:VWA domain-containing protein [Actinomycetota bacterium]
MSRRELSRDERFADVSPELGVVDESAFDELFENDPDGALSLLADMNTATDRHLRELAGRLAGRVVVEAASDAAASRTGVDRLVRRPLGAAEGDLDLDASLDAIHRARRTGGPLDADELVVQTWNRSETAVCLLVDRSGSMHGERLATAAVAAAAVVLRAPLDCSVVAFAEDAVVVKSQHEPRAPEQVVGDLFRLRGVGVTDVGLALRVAREQLSRSRASRRLTVLLSDCRPTAGGSPTADAGSLDELVLLAPEEDHADAEALAVSLGLRWYTLGGPTTVTASLRSALARSD